RPHSQIDWVGQGVGKVVIGCDVLEDRVPSFFATPEGKRFMIASLVLLDRVVFVLGVRVTPFDVGRAAPASHQALGVRPTIFVAEDDCISQARTRRMLPLPVEYQRPIAETSYRVV